MTDTETEVVTGENVGVLEPVPEPADPVLWLLQDVAESEHQLRHPAAFAEVCAASGCDVVRLAHKITVQRRVGG